MIEAIRLSLVVAILATAIVAILGTLIAYGMTRRSFRGQSVVEGLLQLPLVLPPTVTGFFLLALLGREGWLGAPLYSLSGWSVPFTTLACVFAAAIMAFPLMYRSARVAFEAVDPAQRWSAWSLGLSRWQTWLRIELPLSKNGLYAGVALSFARALGEFGATLILAGNIRGRTQTVPLLIYEALSTGRDQQALLLALAMTALSVLVLIVTLRLGRSRG